MRVNLVRPGSILKKIVAHIFIRSICTGQCRHSFSTISMCAAKKNVKHLTAIEAQNIDEELFASGAFSVDQLMELAGLSVAQVVWAEYGVKVVPISIDERSEDNNVLVLCGPGNNGGDGLVAARHLNHFGMQCTVHCPKQPSKDLFIRLVTQAKQANVNFIADLPDTLDDYDVIIDALFGFSFKGDPRPPFDSALKLLKKSEHKSHIVSVDIPSGWNVDSGPTGDDCFVPSALISLTAPKMAAQMFSGTHYLGGRFVPFSLAQKYGLDISSLYESSDQIVKLN
ncbi:uncharacterized protein LOC134845213 isoform X2 [Symsagittifera roscoffensis]|uniref:uncharacterized protein LOC134845213 isoform X2 n=1 Tax=Symsagittifera roscoffensis TaxID=84072 RepID=UPI00307C09C7